jgi:hypothetical protein
MKPNSTHLRIFLCLAVILAAGFGLGRLTAPAPPKTAMAAPPPAETDWTARASSRLVASLGLDETQTQRVETALQPLARELEQDRETTLFKMHLRLLRFHDTLAAEQGDWSPTQLRKLQASRSELKSLILRRFPAQVRSNPEMAVDLPESR